MTTWTAGTHRFNAFLSIGPPRRRVEEMAALIEAGVLDVLGPRLEVRAEDGAWVAHSPDVPGSTVRATTLIEARLPEPDLRRTGDELLTRLLRTGACRPSRHERRLRNRRAGRNTAPLPSD